MTFSGALRCHRSSLLSIHAQAGRPFLVVAVLGALFCGLLAGRAEAQSIIATVNGRPITDLDVAQRMKLLKVLRQPATRDAALQSMIDDQLKDQETSIYQMGHPSDAQIGQQIARTANKLKIPPQEFFSELQRSGVSESHFKDHFSSDLNFFALVQAYHKGIEASESDIRAELAKEGGKSAVTQYHLRQVIFVIPTSLATNMGVVKGRMEAAEQLRSRFADCTSGLPLARAMDNVAVKEEITRDSTELSAAIKQMFDKTPTGHLTAPQRTSEGIEMIALCSKGGSSDDTALRNTISERLLANEVEQDVQKRLKDLRARAIIVKK